ncbi:unnamed protein product [marine sediment metagenome]|uniref:Uncharacterized protein n=1 Tax=marine sediment metagenome TaxID=412755 RepID=X0XPQ0_9ZZZZ
MRWTLARVTRIARRLLDEGGFERAVIERVEWGGGWWRGRGDPTALFRTANLTVSLDGELLLKYAQIEKNDDWLRLC